MDSTSQHLVANFASKTSNSRGNIGDARLVYSTTATFQMDPLSLSRSYFSDSKGSKRKWCANYNTRHLQDGASLALSLGHSSNSCTTMSSGKDIEDSSTMDLGLSVNFHLQKELIAKQKNISFLISKGLEVEKSKLDLELGLSTRHADSDITTVTPGLSSFQNNRESSVVDGSAQLVDEGSTSSRWKLRPLVPPLHTLSNKESATLTDVACSHTHLPPANPNFSSSRVIVPKSSVPSTSEVTHQQQRRNMGIKTCQFSGCTRGARGASGLCIAHGGGRRCQRAGCQKGAEGRTVFCKAHGGGRRCQYLGCTKSAEGRTDYCIGHGGGRRCSHEGCIRAARGRSGLCIRHGGGKRCKMENCTKSAEGISGFCISHGGGRRCLYPACTKGAQGSTMFCKAHGGGKRCTFLGCTKGAEGSTPFCKGHGGGKRCSYEGGCTKSVHGGTLFCVNHGGGKRCAMPGCTKSARGRTNYCVRHGGGKRCKYEGCTKSAQGSTDFCKAHGGGKRCSWGQLGSEFGSQPGDPCDKFARGKSGLCAAHGAQVQDNQIHNSSTLVHSLNAPQSSASEKIKGNNLSIDIETAGSISSSMNSMGYGHQLFPMQIPSQENLPFENGLHHFSLPEGRVHGGNLIAMLRASAGVGADRSNQAAGGPSEQGNSRPMSHSWV